MSSRGIRVGSIAVGRSGDKGDMLDLTLVAVDEAAYQRAGAAADRGGGATRLRRVMPGEVTRYDVPGLRALKYVVTMRCRAASMRHCTPACTGRRPRSGCCWTSSCQRKREIVRSVTARSKSDTASDLTISHSIPHLGHLAQLVRRGRPKAEELEIGRDLLEQHVGADLDRRSRARAPPRGTA